MKRIKVDVSKHDVRLGRRMSFTGCPVARSLSRSLNQRVWVSGLEILCDRGPAYIPTPERVKRFIERFDAQNPVKPFTFTLNVPDEWVRKGGGK